MKSFKDSDPRRHLKLSECGNKRTILEVFLSVYCQLFIEVSFLFCPFRFRLFPHLISNCLSHGCVLLLSAQNMLRFVRYFQVLSSILRFFRYFRYSQVFSGILSLIRIVPWPWVLRSRQTVSTSSRLLSMLSCRARCETQDSGSC